jgi:DNA-binding beta-propeller fold protein YncE
VTTGFYDRPGLAVVDLRTDEVDRLAVGPSPYGVAFAPNGRSAYVSGGGAKGTITRVDPGTGRVHPPIPVGAHPRGLSIVPHGKAALVALNGAAQIARVDLVRRFVTRTIATAPFPHQLVVSPHGTRALVSHNGLDARTVTLVELRGRKKRHRLGVGKDPAGLAFSPSGRTALVAAGSGVVTLLDGKTGRRRRTVRRDGAPRSVVVANGRALVADGRTGRLAAIRLGVS